MVYDEIFEKRERRQRDPEYRKKEYQSHKKYINNNKEKINEYYRKYYKDNKSHMRELAKARTRKYRERNKELLSDKQKEYRSKPEYKINSQLYRRERYLNNIDKERQLSKDNSRNKRLEVLYHYSNGGMKCEICGETHYEFLEIDHIHNDGNRHRNEIGKSGRDLILWILDNNFPYGFQIICRNCNVEKVKLNAVGLKEGATLRQRYNYNYHNKNRIEVLNHYGNNNPKCECCGKNNTNILCVDHIEGNGNIHRKLINTNLIKWIIKNHFPKGFKVLCENCNKSIGLYGYCPHEFEQKNVVP